MMLPALIKRISRARIRASIRGYNKLKRKGKISLVRNIVNNLADFEFSGRNEDISPRIFLSGLSNSEFVVRQYLLERLIGADFHKSLLRAIGRDKSLAYPIPPEWRTVIARHGIRVNNVLSAVMWRLYLFKHLIRGPYVLAQVLLKSLIYLVRGISPRGVYAYFYGLSVANLPKVNAREISYDICTWYASWNGRTSGVTYISHSVNEPDLNAQGVPVKFTPAPYFLLRNAYEIANVIVWSIVAGIEAFISLLRGRWWNALLFAESVKGLAVRFCPADRLPKDCLFHYSGTLYRPLWTYELEAKDSRIICYFYSTYEQPKSPNTDYEPQKADFGPATWPLYLVWDKFQDDQIRRNSSFNFDTLITGPLPFSVGKGMPLELPPKSVAVFDIEPPRLTAALPCSTLGDYIAENPDFTHRFLEDIHKALDNHGLSMAFKKKREIGEKGTKKYRRLVRLVSQKNNVTIVSPDVSAMELIQQCVAVISMPFTSTALYWRELKIPSVYYDPTGWIQPDDRAAHDIKILIGPDELNNWLCEILKSDI